LQNCHFAGENFGNALKCRCRDKPEDYAYRVMWSEEDQAYRGRVAEFTSLAAHGTSPALALREMTEVVGCVLEE
jgi:hypothetical protein